MNTMTMPRANQMDFAGLLVKETKSATLGYIK
jgi:hypothetical protein